jgi:hypothetical protein
LSCNKIKCEGRGAKLNCHTFGRFQNSVRKSQRGKIDTLYTQIHDILLFWLGAGNSIKSDGLN